MYESEMQMRPITKSCTYGGCVSPATVPDVTFPSTMPGTNNAMAAIRIGFQKLRFMCHQMFPHRFEPPILNICNCILCTVHVYSHMYICTVQYSVLKGKRYIYIYIYP